MPLNASAHQDQDSTTSWEGQGFPSLLKKWQHTEENAQHLPVPLFVGVRDQGHIFKAWFLEGGSKSIVLYKLGLAGSGSECGNGLGVKAFCSNPCW